VVKPRTLYVATVKTNAKGIAVLSRPVIVPLAARRNLTTALRWFAIQYPKSVVAHALTGTTYAKALTVTLLTRR
jgi:hypothetical protein